MTTGDLTLDHVFLEARFPRRMGFIDHVGHLADGFDDLFEEVQLSPTEIRLSDESSGGELVLAPEGIVVMHSKGDRAWATSILATATRLVGKIVGLEAVDYVGARQILLLDIGGVSETTAMFRSLTFNYREGPFTAFGKEPIEARAIVAYRLDEGACRIQATAVSRRPHGDPVEIGRAEPTGALLLDVDRTHDVGMDGWEIPDVAEGLLTDGYSRAIDFVARLKMPTDEAETGGD